MSTRPVAKREALSDAARLTNTQHGRGPEQFAGTSDALYEQHRFETSHERRYLANADPLPSTTNTAWSGTEGVTNEHPITSSC